MVVFGFYTGVFIFLLRSLILREDFGTGPLPDLPPKPTPPRSPHAPRAGRLVTTTEDTTDGARRDRVGDGPDRMPGEPDMWFFVFFESLLFTSYFCVYLYFRTQNEARLPRSPVAAARCGSASSTRSCCSPARG